MTNSKTILMLALLITGALFAQDAVVTPVMSKDLPEFPGKEGLMIRLCIRLEPRIQSIGTMRTLSCMCWKAPSSCR